ncbi:MAG: NmrA family NAD(P)-binding protein, partial [Deltaproteobacteria bacterium]|nr:NmrA family NAD(P)-binding protein [Deltaproteobacteria bacterium]
MFVITGVTGHTGSVAATTLLAAGKPVRVVVRDAAKGEAWKAKGAEVAIAEIGDRAAFAKALTGATGAYILMPPFAWTATGIPAERAKLVEAIAGAVADAKPGHVVLLSSVGADQPSGTGPVAYLHALETKLATTGVPSTFLRASSFMENWGSMLKGAIDGGALYYG